MCVVDEVGDGILEAGLWMPGGCWVHE
jgi:hypothetical protein